jgi:hypothetical protein
MYTHAASETDRYQRVLGSFAAFSLPAEPVKPSDEKGQPGDKAG